MGIDEKNEEIAKLQKQLEELPQTHESIAGKIRMEEEEKRKQLEEQIRKEEEAKRIEDASRIGAQEAELKAMQLKDEEIAKLQKQLEDLPNYQAYDDILQKIKTEEEEKRKQLEEQIRKEETEKRKQVEEDALKQIEEAARARAHDAELKAVEEKKRRDRTIAKTT